MRLLAALVALSALGACSSVGPAPPTERPVVEATACPDLAVTLYFEPGAAALPPSADAVVATISQTLERCRARYSPVKQVVIAGAVNRSADGATGQANAQARAEAVKAKLVDLGIRPGRIRIVAHDEIDDDPGQPLRRHADVRISFGVKR